MKRNRRHKNGYRYQRAAQRKAEIDTRQNARLFRELLDLLTEPEPDIDTEITDIEALEYDAFYPTR